MFKPLEKVMNIVRNFGAVVANTVAMYHPDDQKKLSGSLFNIYAVLDSVQKFLPKPFSENYQQCEYCYLLLWGFVS